jgi:hypothetical protein
MREPTSAEKAVFGHNCKIGPDDKPIEQGHGAKQNETPSHFKALERMEKLQQISRQPGVTAKEIGEIVRAILNPPENMTEEERVKHEAQLKNETEAEAAKDQEIVALKAQNDALKERMDRMERMLEKPAAPVEPEKAPEF